MDQATLDAALVRLAEMPLDTIPAVAAPPAHSRMPLSRNPLFVGREKELKRLAASLKGGDTVAVSQIAAATGMGGIGKTQLAAAFVHRYGQYFQGGVFWLNFADSANIPEEIAQCGAAMTELRLDFSQLKLADRVHLVLAAWQSELPRLLVFDNCEEPALLARWRPPVGNCRMLVTSRRQQWDAVLGVQAVTLDTLPRAQSIELLRKFPPALNMPPFTEDEEPILDAIAEALGDLPLALHLAGSYLATNRDDMAPADYLNELASPHLLDHLSLQEGDLSPTAHEQHVARTFALSYEQLDATNAIDALTLALLRRAACFAPGEPIPRALLVATLEQADDAPPDRIQAGKALRRLTDLGLVEREEDGAILLHRLIGHFVRAIEPQAHSEAQQAVESVILAEANRLNNAGIPAPLLAWQSHLRAITDTARSRTDETAAGLCNELGYLLRAMGDYEAARPYYQQALDIRRAVLGEQHPDTARSLNNMGYLLQAMGELEAARPYYQQALDIFEDRLGHSHPDTQTVRNNLTGLIAQWQQDI